MVNDSGEIYTGLTDLVDLDFSKKTTIVNTNEISEWGDIIYPVKYRQDTQSKRPILSADGLEFNATNNSELYRNNDGISYSNMIIKVEWIPRTSGNYLFFNKELIPTDRLLVYFYNGKYYFSQNKNPIQITFSTIGTITPTLNTINRMIVMITTDANNAGNYYAFHCTSANDVFGYNGNSSNNQPNLSTKNGTFLIGEEVAYNYTSGNFALRKIRIHKKTGFVPTYLDAKKYAEDFVNGLID